MFTLTPTITDDLLNQVSAFLPAMESEDVRRAIRKTVGAVLIVTGSATATPYGFGAEPPSCSKVVLRDQELRDKIYQHDIATGNRLSLNTSRSLQITFEDVCRAAASLEATDAMLKNVYNLVSCGQTQKAMVAVFRAVSSAMNDNDASRCDRIIRAIDLGKLDADTILAVLTSTYPARAVLPSRSSFYNRAMVHLVRAMGAERAHDVADRMK